MADELDALLERVDDAGLRSELRDHIDRLRRRRQFGLVFESHLPERVRLPDHPIRRGSKVVRRGSPAKAAPQEVLRVKGDKVVLAIDDGTEEVASDDLVVVAEFGEPIYPGLRRLGSIDRGGDKPAHVVIKGENYHALEALRFTHAGKVDCIYIDPPYNTGARDWKYDNDYVDADDGYRHSKWLAFMERRLRIAGDLLNPDDSVLIVTIDENEVNRLGLLLEQTFPEASIQMVSIVINRSGVSSGAGLSRVEEYAFFCFMGTAAPSGLSTDLLEDRPAGDAKAGRANVRWEWLLRGGGSWYRDQRPNLCYPVVLNESGERIVAVGEPWSGEDERQRPATQDGLPLAWPIRSDGRLGIWRLQGSRLMELAEKGYAYVSDGSKEKGSWTIRYLLGGTVKAIDSGEMEITGRGDRGQVLVSGTQPKRAVPKTVWSSTRHIAGGAGGTQLITTLLGDRDRFPYPKSVYAVEDSIGVAVADKPDALILDFFSGSGTTTHAAMRLNRQDGGARRSISVTNNEVSASDAVLLTEHGYSIGDPQWESRGIFEHVTRPRITAAATGSGPDGKPIDGSYKFNDEFPIADGFEENVEFLELRYLDIEDVELDLAFESVAPLLWMRAGGSGPVIDQRCDAEGEPKAYDCTDHYGVLFDPDRWRGFVEKLPDSAGTVFVVTDSPSVFASVAAELPTHVDVVRLYENYLSTFAINRGR